MKKKDARILWNIDEESGLITDVLVEEFKAGCSHKWPLHVYEKFNFHIGNADVKWDSFNSLSYVLIILFCEFGLKDNKVANKVILELSKIEEFRKEILNSDRVHIDVLFKNTHKDKNLERWYDLKESIKIKTKKYEEGLRNK